MIESETERIAEIVPSKELNMVAVSGFSSISSMLSMKTEISEKNGSSSGNL